jgi:Ca2+-binding RTX toxin-like protein
VLSSSGTGNGGSGLVIQTGDNEARAFTEHVTVTGGAFDGNGRYGIEARQANDISIGGAHIGDNGMGGIRFSGVAHAGLDGVVYVGNAGDPVTIDSGYVQTFGDGDPLNDRWVPTTDIRLDGVVQFIPVVVPGAPLWSYAISDGNDTIIGSDGRDVIASGSGNDWVMSGAGDDVLYGNDGNDMLDGGAGRDTLYGGAGDDWLIYSGALVGAVETMDGGAGNDTADFMTAAAGVRVDLLSGGIEVSIGGVGIVDLVRVENARGSAFADTLIGDGNANKLVGLEGNDALYGSGGADILEGGAGDDLIVGGLNKDLLTGGAGRDTFRFAAGDGADTITDFTRGEDVIDLLGVATFATLKFKQIGTDTQIKIGLDTILLHNVVATTLTAGDFQFH